MPPHRLTPLQEKWEELLNPLVEHLLLQVRYNPRKKTVELKTSDHTEDIGALQKGADFIQAFMLGFCLFICFLAVWPLSKLALLLTYLPVSHIRLRD